MPIKGEALCSAVLTFVLFLTAIALRMRLGIMVFLPRRLGLRLRLRRAGLRWTWLGLRLRRAHLNMGLRCRTWGFHVRFGPALLRLRPGVHLRLRRLVVRVLLRGLCWGAVEAIQLLTTVLWLRLRVRRLRVGLRQLRTRLEAPALLTRCAGRAVALRRACRHARRALRRLRSLRLSRGFLRRGSTRQGAWTVDRAWRHQRLRSRSRLGTTRPLRTLRIRRAHQALRPVRSVLFLRSARLAAGVRRRTLRIRSGVAQP